MAAAAKTLRLSDGDAAAEAPEPGQGGWKRPPDPDAASAPGALDGPTTPVRLTPSLDPATLPRLRTSISSHDRLVADDSFLPDAPSRAPEPEPGAVPPATDGRAENAAAAAAAAVPGTKGPGLLDLPEETQQRILDMLMGELKSTVSCKSGSTRPLRNWNSAMRHPRSRGLSDLALVCPRWRTLVQERIYRHIKIEGTIQTVQSVWDWFVDHKRLGSYVRHVDFWVPIWERRGGARAAGSSNTPAPAAAAAGPALVGTMADVAGQHWGTLHVRHIEVYEPVNEAYCMSSRKSTLDELFDAVANLFPGACILTIEGGQCKKPPMIEHFRDSEDADARNGPPRRLAALPRVHTLIVRGAWNVMRTEAHFKAVTGALPALREWHCSYTKPKAKAYLSMHAAVVHVPATLTHLNLSLDGFYSQKNHIGAHKAQALLQHSHLCATLGAALPLLEVVTLSGRFCACLLDTARAAAAEGGRAPRLRSLDVSVKNVCRPLDEWNDGAGIHNWGFICAFERLVGAAARALAAFPALAALRLRYVDLDADCPLLHPYFQLRGAECAGLWSPDILRDLEAARPHVAFADLSDSLDLPAAAAAMRAGAAGGAAASAALGGGPGMSRSGAAPVVGVAVPARRPKSIRAAMYAAFVDGHVIY